jgi:hypothetical protein
MKDAPLPIQNLLKNVQCIKLFKKSFADDFGVFWKVIHEMTEDYSTFSKSS